MKKNIYNLLTILLLLLILSSILIYSQETLKSVLFAFNIWEENIFPSLFPFFVISDLLMNYGFVNILGELTKKIMNKLFYLPGEASFVIIASMLSGFPSSAKFVKSLLEEQKINTEEAEYLLSFTHFSNPLFVIGVIGSTMLKSKKLGFIILFCHIISNFIIAIVIRKKREVDTSTINIDKLFTINSNKSFIQVLTSSITKTINTLILLLGIVTTFLVLSTLISNLINLNDFTRAIVSGILEMTQGIKYISVVNIPLYLKATIMTVFISFGGISIHLQIMSILSDTQVKYKNYFISRVAHASLAGVLVLVLTKLF